MWSKFRFDRLFSTLCVHATGETVNTNKKQEQGTCASSCGVNQAYVGEGQATAPGATQVNANHIIQYPRQPRIDDGRWISIGTLIGSILGKFADNHTVNKAKDAEDKWKRINEKLKEIGDDLFDKAPKELDQANGADTLLQNQFDWDVSQRDAELARAEKLDNCNDTLHDKLCQFAQCGYVPDYEGIKSRIMADVAQQSKKKREELCANLNRYSKRACCGIETSIAVAGISTAVSAIYKAREDERARAWQINEQLLFKATEIMERDRNTRAGNARELDKTATSIQEKRYTNHIANYSEWIKTGGDFLASSGKNYAFLADSYRKTAEKIGSDLAKLGGLIATVALVWSKFGDNGDKCGEGGASG